MRWEGCFTIKPVSSFASKLEAYQFSIRFAIHMRLLVFILTFCFLLLSGGNNASAGVLQQADGFVFSQQITSWQPFKYTNEDYSIVLIESNDFVLEEEDQDDENRNKFKSSAKESKALLESFLVYSPIFHLDSKFARPFSYPLSGGNTCPIYIFQRVIRI